MALFTKYKNSKLQSLLQNKIVAAADATVLNDTEIRELLTEYFSTAMRSPEQQHLKYQGDYISNFRGGGLEFEELRLYQPGDDIRSIDWKTTARTNKPYVRINKKEQRSSILIYLDFSNSMHFGTQQRLKSSQAARLAVLLIAKVIKKDTDITLAIYNGENTCFYNKKSGTRNIFELISYLNKSTLKIEHQESKTSFTQSLEGIAIVSNSYENVYIMSDFKNFAKAALPSIAALATSGIIKLIKITDPVEYRLPKIGKTNFFDICNNKYININTNASKIRKELLKKMQTLDLAHKTIAEEIGLKIHYCSTTDDTLKFFIKAGMNL